MMLTFPGVDAPRAFSIANPPSDASHVELQVRRVPGGAGTGYVHERLKLGDRVRFSGPYGRFLVRKSRGGPLMFPRRRHRRLEPALDDPRPSRRGL